MIILFPEKQPLLAIKKQNNTGGSSSQSTLSEEKEKEDKTSKKSTGVKAPANRNIKLLPKKEPKKKLAPNLMQESQSSDSVTVTLTESEVEDVPMP